MSIAHTHLTETRVRLTTSPVIRTFSVIEERVGLDYGYLRVRVELVNDAFLGHTTEFVKTLGQRPAPLRRCDSSSRNAIFRTQCRLFSICQ